jgi:hypothetical protein
MADAVPYDDILSKFADNKLDTKEFLDLLFSQDENGVDYLQSLRKEFKEKYVLNAYKKASDYYNKISEKITPKQTDETLDKILDPFDLKKLNKEYKEKLKKIYDDKLKEINANVVVDKQIKNPISDTNVEKVLPESVKNASQEQKTFGEKPTKVTLSEETLQDFNNLLTNNLNLKNLRLAREKETAPVESGGGFLSELLPLLLGGGVAALLISTFWDSHIKPWLEEKLDLKLDILDRFEGTVEAIGKFFTLGGLKIGGGWLFNLVGKAFTTFGDLLEGSLKAIFNFGFGDEAVKAGVKAAPSVWKTLLPKVAGGLFKGVGLISLKAIPIIGSLISFYFAYDNFQKGKNINGIIDIINGIVGFIPYAGIPLSLGLSALNAFLDYKAGDVKGIEAQESMKMDYVNKIVKFIEKIPFIGGLIKFGRGIYELASGNFKNGLDFLTETPFLGPFPAILQALVNSGAIGGDGSESFSWDKFFTELNLSMFRWICSFIPNVGGLRGKVARWMGIDYNDTTEDLVIDDNPIVAEEKRQMQQFEKNQKRAREVVDKKIKNITVSPSIKTEEEILELQKELKKITDSLKNIDVESALKKDLGFLYPVFKRLGLDSDRRTAPREGTEAFKVLSEQQKLINRAEILVAEIKKFKKTSKENLDDSNTTEKTPDYFDKNLKFQSFSNAVKRDDYELMGSKEQSILLDNKTKTANILNENDNVLAYKKDGILDQTLKDICNIITLINKNVQKLPENIPVSSPSIVMGGQSGQSGGNSMSYSPFSGTRDSIYEFRLMNKRGVEIV